ncbi:MAG TPA: radical SAM/SPASM family putative metalloenzyme maturase [Nitrospirota bacterium]|nr:radical SAM/SPASM family putative metalloenzyme maturase [Nitrospirota bacterium]
MVPNQHPSKLLVEVTTHCNLQCGMCVKQNGTGGIPEGNMSPETFERLAPAFPHLHSLVLNGIGESLLHPQLETFIARARALLPESASVGFQSNGMLLTDERAASLVDAGLDRICISLDTVSDDSFRSIRSGGKMEGIVAAFAGLNKARARARKRDLAIGIEFVLMRDNITDLPEAIRWAGRSGAGFAIVSQLLPYHKDLVAQTVYDTNTTAAIAVYERWKTKALREGLDIRRYLHTITKVGRTPEEERIVQLVEQMRNDAAAEGTALHIERLLRRDDEWLASAERILDEARQAAQEEGMDLTLPGMAPRNTRKCEFVEGGGAFVSWDGNVHPCYFLWHRYACYVGGVGKRVKPWIFGNVRDRDLPAIWNDGASRSFRERVLGYQFPFCFDCGFALCDYVSEEEFEQDCYLGQVPCGACLWCTGLFHCLS